LYSEDKTFEHLKIRTFVAFTVRSASWTACCSSSKGAEWADGRRLWS